MATKATTKRKGKAKLPPVGTRWNGRAYPCDWFEVRPDGLMFHSHSRGWEPSNHNVQKLDRMFGPRIPPKKPARDTAAMRRKAVAGVLGGWVVGTKRLEKLVHKNGIGDVICTVTVTVPAKHYAAFLADPTCGGAAS